MSIILLGGTSDLAMRLLLPGLGEYVAASGRRVEVIGAGREDVEDYQAQVNEAVGAGAAGARVPARYFAGDATDRTYLEQLVDAAEGSRIIFYFALAPAVSMKVIEAMRGMGLPADTSFAMEKPYGNSAAEADALDRELHALAGEDAIYRVDHFLSEPAVGRAAALVATQGAPATFDFIYEEDLGLEGRAEFYDSTGATRDMIQSHLLQASARILAGGPGATRVRAVLGAFELVPGSVRRARYAGYADEEGVDPARGTETLVELKVSAGDTVITMRTGKGFARSRKEVMGITLYDAAFSPYGFVIRALIERDHTAFVPQGAPQQAWRLMEAIERELRAAPMGEYPLGTAN